MMEVFAGFLSHIDHHFGRLIAFLKAIGQFDNTLIMLVSDNGASAEGGPTRLVQREQVLQQRAGLAGREPEEDRRTGRPDDLQSLLLGLDLRRQYAVPPLEARDLSRRHQRPVHRPLAQGHQGQGRNPHAVRPRHRPGADRARGARHRGADLHQRRDPVADRGRQLRPCLRRRQGALEAHHPVLRDDGAPVHLSRRLARGVPVAGTSFKEAGCGSARRSTRTS